MMREVLSRRFKRLMNDAPRDVAVAPPADSVAGQMAPAQELAPGRARIVRDTLRRGTLPVLLVPVKAAVAQSAMGKES